MNTYTRTTITDIDQSLQLQALDEATGRKLPTDILQYVLLPMLDTTETTTETMITVKLQPRDAFGELKNYCHLYNGCCGVCSFNTATCLCMTPAVVLNVAIRGAVVSGWVLVSAPFMIGAGLADSCCNIQCRTLRRCDVRFMRYLSNNCVGDCMPCAGDDYRLKRSCCHDVVQLANQCCCCASFSVDLPAARNGPEAMWME